MKKFFLSALLFGTLLSTSTTVVSCSDDYDDSEIRKEMQSDKDLIADLSAKLSALKTAQEALPSKSEVEAAKQAAIEAAKSESDAKAAAALKAAIEADAQQMNKVNELVAALKSEIETALALHQTDIAALKEKSKSFDAKLAELDGVLSTLDALEGNLQDLESKVAGLKTDFSALLLSTEANKTSLEELKTKLSDLKATTEESVKELDGKIGELDGKIGTNISDIAKNHSLIEAQQTALDTYEKETGERFTKLEKALEDSKKQFEDFKTRIDNVLSDITNEDLKAFKTFLANWEETKAAIDKQFSDLEIKLVSYVDSLITGIRSMGFVRNTWIYASVVNDKDFGPEGAVIKVPKKGASNGLFGYEFVFKANPSKVDWSKLNLTFENTLGQELPVLKIGAPHRNNILFAKGKTKKASQSGLWRAEVIADWSDMNSIDTSGEDALDYFVKKYLGGGFNHFALVASEKEYAAESEPRKVYSDYEFRFVPHYSINIDNATVSGKSINIYQGESPLDGEYMIPVMESATAEWSNIHIWKKYVTVKTGAKEGEVEGVNQLVNGTEPIRIASKSEDLCNKTVTMTMHYMNFDGTRSTTDFDVTFLKKRYEDSKIEITSQIDFSKLALKQTSKAEELVSLVNHIKTVDDLSSWSQEIKSIKVEGIAEGETKAMYDGLELIMDDENDLINPMTLSVGQTMAVTADMAEVMSKISTLKAIYNANELIEAGLYAAKVTFMDVNGYVVNELEVAMTVDGPKENEIPFTKITNAWNDDLTIANVWAQIDDNGVSSVYDISSSYNGELTDVRFKSTEETPAFAPFGGSNTSFVIDDASTIKAHDNGYYAAQSLYSSFGWGDGNWALTNDFKIRMRSAIDEADIHWKSGVPSLSYTAEGKIVITKNDILAVDPSSSSSSIYYLGTNNPRSAAQATDRDYRIKEITFSIVDGEASSGSSNVGLVEIVEAKPATSIKDATQITIQAKAKNGEYPALSANATLQLKMQIKDVFGFTRTKTLDFTVLKEQNN